MTMTTTTTIKFVCRVVYFECEPHYDVFIGWVEMLKAFCLQHSILSIEMPREYEAFVEICGCGSVAQKLHMIWRGMR